ncbi:PPR repeat [Musa troglodytarum]|uniref:PPR repeat n=1 Tax=Musa troglodytarum TaxID=320322 RepID=A0A9E7GPC5_9LILI|nr:PPR repeat [Musa troglodytarum]
MYSKSGAVDTAKRLFDEMPDRSVVTWTTMIGALAQNGHPEEALALFRRMLEERVRPNRATFLTVMPCNAIMGMYSRCGKIEQARKLFDGIAEKDLASWSSMIEAYARADILNSARRIFDQMREKNLVTWSIMISGYGMHGRGVEVLELFNRMKCLMKPDHITFVSVLSACSHAGLIDEGWQCFNSMTTDIRVLMRKRGVKKIADLIYRELERLMDRIKEAGYVPNTNFALHDVEEETQVKSLYMHSEKLAIVFGLINTRPESTIRVHKNLRVCGDCHTATKFISKVTKRKIVMRDSHRFHHFSDGECSCGDYW